MSNDRLKFRAWDDENLCWVRPKLVENESGVTVDERGYELFQWTGLYDSEGVEIYESDFVSLWYAPGSTAKGWIKFENGGFYFKTPEAYPNSCLAHDCVFEHGNSFRVTGNKFETQDIMERG